MTRHAPSLVLVAAAATALVAAVAGLPLAWDGSLFLFLVLNDQAPLLIMHRYIETILTLPVLLASGATEDLAVLRTIFSLTYTVVPLVALASSWLVVRRRPELFIWPVLGIGLALVPGRAVFIAESLIAAQLTWPLLLAALVPVSRGVLLLCLLLGVAVALTHPAAVILLVGAALIGALFRRASRPSGSAWIVALLGLAVLNVALIGSQLTAFERRSIELPVVVAILVLGALGPQLVAMVLTALVCALVVRAARTDRPADRIQAEGLALISTGLAGVALLVWAAVPEFWRGELAFRHWAVPATLPLFVLAALDARRAAGSPAVLEGRMRIASVAAVTMFLVLLVQSLVWVQLTSGVSRAVRDARGCVDAASIEGFEGSALEHWSITPLSIVLQGRDVGGFVAPADACRTAEWPAEVVILENAFRPGWFRFH